ncbi:MAG: FliG C-terminal domain-containing protein [Balneolaceae bacterium]
MFLIKGINFSILNSFSGVARRCSMFMLATVYIALIGTETSFSQTTSNVSTTESIELRVSILEQNYDAQLIQVLANYFDRNKFFVDVDITADMVSESFSTPGLEIVRERPRNIMMPGLPFIPESNLNRQQESRNTATSTVNQNVLRTLRLVNLTANIFADSSLTDKEIDFMRRIAGIAVKADLTRGDKINITRISIPDFTTKPVPIKVDSLPAQLPEFSGSNSTGLAATLKQYTNELIILGALLLILLVYLLLRKPKEQLTSASTRDGFKNDVSLQNPIIASRQIAANQRPTQPQDEGIFDDLIAYFFNKPQEIALLFEYWIDSSPNGVQKAANVIQAVDKHLIRSLKKDLSSENYLAISDALETTTDMPTAEKLELAQNFFALLNSSSNNTSGTSKHGKLGLFKFLSHLNNKQVMELFVNEDTQTIALVLDYLPKSRSAQILEQFESDKATHVIITMATLHTLSYMQHSKISSKLFDKAMTLLDRQKEEQIGAENILPVLESIPIKDQQRYIDQLIATGSPVGEIIKQQFLTIEQIPELDEDILKEAISPLNTDLLLSALIGLDDKIVNAILAVRPSREQRLIHLEIDHASIHEVEDSTYEAQAILMDSIRQVVSMRKIQQNSI